MKFLGLISLKQKPLGYEMCVSKYGTEPYGRLPTYLYPRGSGPNIVQNVNFLFRNSQYVCGLGVRNMWLWISCVKVQKHLIEKVFNCLQQPKNNMSGKILCSHKQPENVCCCCYCCCVSLVCTLTCDLGCIPWFVILVVYLDFSRLKRWIFLNHFGKLIFF
jgi:hypothetical protein